MNVSKIQCSTVNPKFTANTDSGYENPVSRSTEKKLAILGSVAGSSALGAVAGGLVSTAVKEGKKLPLGLGIGAGVALLSLFITLPAKLYGAKVNAFTREKEMDVFSRDRDLKSSLTEEVHTEVKNPDISLDKKLDDNLKLQMANKGNAIGLANLTSQVK